MTIIPSSQDDAALPALPVIRPDMVRSTRQAIEDLMVASEATKLAVDAAKEAPYRISSGTAEQSEILESWRANVLLVHKVFDHLYYEVRHAVSTVELLLDVE